MARTLEDCLKILGLPNPQTELESLSKIVSEMSVCSQITFSFLSAKRLLDLHDVLPAAQCVSSPVLVHAVRNHLCTSWLEFHSGAKTVGPNAKNFIDRFRNGDFHKDKEFNGEDECYRPITACIDLFEGLVSPHSRIGVGVLECAYEFSETVAMVDSQFTVSLPQMFENPSENQFYIEGSHPAVHETILWSRRLTEVLTKYPDAISVTHPFWLRPIAYAHGIQQFVS